MNKHINVLLPAKETVMTEHSKLEKIHFNKSQQLVDDFNQDTDLRWYIDQIETRTVEESNQNDAMVMLQQVHDLIQDQSNTQ